MEEAFHRYAPLLLAVAYRMLGSSSDAEDIVQECYVRYAQASAKEIHSLKSYLTTTVIRLCLDHLKSARAQRENDSGSGLSEQLLTTNLEDVVLSILEQREAIAVAFQVLSERLTPDERAVFLLYEVFDYRYEEIAEIIGKSVVHCRQLLHRAKKHLGDSHARFTPSPLAQQRLVERFMGACQLGELQVLIDLLTQDVTRWAHLRGSPCFAEEGLQ